MQAAIGGFPWNKNLTLTGEALYWGFLGVDLRTDLEKLHSRDPDFLREIFERINPVLFRVLGAQKIFHEKAEELVQQTWERFFTNLEKFEGRSEIQTFVCGILLNKVREERRRSNKIVLEDDLENSVAGSFHENGLWAKAPADPSDLKYHQELGAFIDECLEGLTEQQKAAFVLREVHDEESEDIAVTLGVSLTNLRVLLFRAKEKLRLCLTGHLGESP